MERFPLKITQNGTDNYDTGEVMTETDILQAIHDAQDSVAEFPHLKNALIVNTLKGRFRDAIETVVAEQTGFPKGAYPLGNWSFSREINDAIRRIDSQQHGKS